MKNQSAPPPVDPLIATCDPGSAFTTQMPTKAAMHAPVALRRFLLELVALVYKVEPAQILSPTRGRREIAFARQVAMYLAHTKGGLSLSLVGRLFGRDRTTVAHACALVEDARDEPVFDRTLAHFESAIACRMELFGNRDHAQCPKHSGKTERCI